MNCKHQKHLRIVMLAALSFISVSLFAQEDCTNGIDDDSDGLIDLNDPDCSCYVIQADSLVADFEEMTCCPSNFTGGGTGIECLVGWSQASFATSDYLHLCDFIGGTVIPEIPMPLPSGEGAIGIATGPGYAEYVGQCMESTMLAGETYTAMVNVGFSVGGSVWTDASPLDFGIYGTSSCANFPMAGLACPENETGWFEIATIVIDGPDTGWVEVTFDFTLTSNVEAIAFGAACSEIGGILQYHFIDHIVIQGTYGGEEVDVDDIAMTGNCVDGVELSIPEITGSTYQWYLDGVAIPGATGSTYSVPTGEDGEYTVLVDNVLGCGTGGPLVVEVDPNVLAITGDVVPVDCNGASTGSIDITLPTGNDPFDIAWSTGQTTEDLDNILPGIYQVTVTDANGCFGTATFPVSQPTTALEGTVINIVQPVGSGGQGGAEVEGMGGTPLYSYSWDNGESTQVATMLDPGTHYVTITDANGCEEILEVVINESLLFIETIVHQSCFNACDGSIELEVSGGVPTYSYSWDDGSQTPILDELCDGFYIVTITDAAGTELEANFEIETPDEVVIIGEYTDVICVGQVGQITTEVTGGTPDYSYIWSNGETTPDIFDLFLDEYTLTVTDAEGCTAVEEFMIEILDSLLITGDITQESCGGGGDGAIDLSISNGSGPFTYLWNTGFTGEDLTNLFSGTYSVTVVDALGCDGSAVFIVSEGGDLDILIDVVDASCQGLDNGSIDLNVDGGTPPYIYNWDTGESTPGISGLSEGSYQVTVEDNGGCEWTNVISVGSGDGVAFGGTVTDASCWDSSNGAIDIEVTLGTAPISFAWAGGQVSEDLTDLSSGSYTVTVTDDSGCSDEMTFVIDAPEALTLSGIATGASCPGVEDGGVSTSASGGIDPYDYLWSTGDMAADLSNVGPGDYMLTVTDANGCTVEMNFNVPSLEPISLVSQVTSASCNGGSDGAIDITPDGGNPPFMYVWSNGETTEDIIGLTAGQYMVTVTDDRGCMLIEQIDVFGAGSITVQGSVFEIDCNGAMNGAIDLTVNGGTAPINYIWSNGDMTEDLTGLGAGTYGVTITDAQGCEIEASYVIGDIPELTLDGVVVDVLCNGGMDGSIAVSAIGGSPPYDFMWSTGGSSPEIQGLAAGIYTVTVTDLNGCQVEEQYDVIEPPLLDIAIISITNPTMGGDFGSAEVQVTGGTPPYMINWSNGESGTTANMLPLGSTFVTAIDANGCMIGIEVVISVSAFSVNYTSQTNACFGDCLGEIALQLAGGLPPYTINWSDGQSGDIADALCNGNYDVTVTDGQGEEVVLQGLEITSPPEIVLSGVSEDPTCISSDDGQISLDITGGVEPYNLLWSTGWDQQLLTDLSPGQYTVTVTDANACSASDVYTIENIDALSLTVAPVNIDCNTASGSIIISGNNPNNYPYLLNGQIVQTVQDSIITGLEPGVYDVAYEINANCQVPIDQVEIFVTSEFDITLLPENTDVSFGESVDFEVSISGVISAYEIVWTTQEGYDCIEQDSLNNCTTISLVPNESQSLSVQVVDGSGCSLSSTSEISVLRERNIFVPNVFSPNGDGVNDVFTVTVGDQASMIKTFKVFNRWGEEVYSESSRAVSDHLGWDGNYKGQLVQPGVYVYFVEVEYADGETELLKGDVTVIR